MKIGVLGLGKMGGFHLKKLETLLPSENIRTFDTNAALSSYTDLQQFFYEVDGVIISSPTPTHYSYAKQALETGVHVLVEKPICEEVEQAEELIEISKRNDLVLAVGFLERFRLKYFLKGQELSGVFQIETHRETPHIGRDPDTDVILDLLVHDIDLVLSLINEEIEEINCSARKVVTKVWDEVSVELKFSKGSKAKLVASRVAKELKRTFATGINQFDFAQPIEMDPLLEQTKNFLDCIQNKKQPEVSGLAGLKSLEVVKKIQKKLLNNPISVAHEVRI